jgi:outer membrane lipoprotein SlyB
MKLTKIVGSLVMLLTLAVTGCGKDMPGDYDAAEVGKIKKVVPGTIVSMRPVRLHNKNADIGITGHANTQPANLDANVTGSHGYEYVIKLNSGGIISVVQAEQSKLKVKQKILVIYGRNTRVVPDNGSENF